jgi:hypothetical protein
MQPSFYFSDIVLPTVQEFLVARNDRRRAYLACITAFHICDYIVRAESPSLDQAAMLKLLYEALRSECAPSFFVIQGICNGSKRAGADRNYRFDPGSERDVPVFAFDIPGAGLDQGRWDVPGLEVEYNGQRLFVDWCLQAFLLSVRKLYPHHFHGVDFDWIDGAFGCRPSRQVAG